MHVHQSDLVTEHKVEETTFGSKIELSLSTAVFVVCVLILGVIS